MQDQNNLCKVYKLIQIQLKIKKLLILYKVFYTIKLLEKKENLESEMTKKLVKMARKERHLSADCHLTYRI